MNQPTYKVLIVDDSAFMRSILTRMIEKEPQFEVIGKATNGAEGVEMAAKFKPDVITMDIEMPIMNGIEALEKIMATNPTPVLMVSSLTEEGASATLESLEKGAVDFIPKSLQDKEKTILQASQVLHQKLMAAVSARMGGRPAAAPAPSTSSQQATATPQTRPAPPATPAVTRPKATGRLIMPKLFLIGASTGGPRALQTLIPGLPANLPVPVVIAQHMPANFTATMAQRLNETSQVTVVEAADGMVLEPATVYIAPGGQHTRVVAEGGNLKLQVRPDKGESVYHPSVDVLAGSVAQAVSGSKVLALMLTGMGSDGARQFRTLSDEGAYILAQDETSCVVYGMPRAVVEDGIANEVLPLSDILAAVTRLL